MAKGSTTGDGNVAMEQAARNDAVGGTSGTLYSIEDDTDVVMARTAARDLAADMGFSLVDKTRIATAVSELARNTLVHGGGGRMEAVEAADNGRKGLRFIFLDDGPGIEDTERALDAGFSTGNSLGQGLPGAERLSDEFHIESTVGKGTRVEFTKWRS